MTACTFNNLETANEKSGFGLICFVGTHEGLEVTFLMRLKSQRFATSYTTKHILQNFVSMTENAKQFDCPANFIVRKQGHNVSPMCSFLGTLRTGGVSPSGQYLYISEQCKSIFMQARLRTDQLLYRVRKFLKTKRLINSAVLFTGTMAFNLYKTQTSSDANLGTGTSSPHNIRFCRHFWVILRLEIGIRLLAQTATQASGMRSDIWSNINEKLMLKLLMAWKTAFKMFFFSSHSSKHVWY
jgi:hypothetical protein